MTLASVIYQSQVDTNLETVGNWFAGGPLGRLPNSGDDVTLNGEADSGTVTCSYCTNNSYVGPGATIISDEFDNEGEFQGHWIGTTFYNYQNLDNGAIVDGNMINDGGSIQDINVTGIMILGGKSYYSATSPGVAPANKVLAGTSNLGVAGTATAGRGAPALWGLSL